ncbi:YceI family protein [Micropruina glycogenica]|uniref:Polyisoprenoid-binding protein n=1 Tax=Micropruina glycogenica TaxID=75385 RepID=A0A2N9JL40_9ACTN|nr:YceI family protein [Micropruina glycogenica]SPD88302.1 Polyisoprenoid-binding protein [Micropruina glycogenica]
MTAAATPATLADLRGTFVLDASHSQLGFVARHAMVTKVRGSFTDVTGTASVDGANPSASSLSVTIKSDSINTRSEGRDAHLRSADFFDVEKYPEITFTGTDFSIDGDTVDVTGDLTIKGTTHSVTVPLEYQGAVIDPWGNERIGFEGSVVVNRKDWGLTWNAAIESGGVLVSEKVTLEFEISAVKQA